MTRRILLSYLTIGLFTLLVLEIPLGIFVSRRERERLASGLERDAITLAGAYEVDLELGLPLDSGDAERYTASTGARVVVLDADGIVQLDTRGETGRAFDTGTREEITRALSGEATVSTRYSNTLGTSLQLATVPVLSDGVVEGVVRLSLPTSEVDQRVRRVWVSLGAVGAVVLGAMAVVGWTIARSVTRPLRQLERSASRLSQGDLSARAALTGAPQQVQELADTFDVMAGRLEQLVASQRAFVADASHQLLTPLAALRLRLENLEAHDASDQRELDAAIGETARLAELVEQLLHLARAQNEPPRRVVVDVAALAADRVDVWLAMAGERQVSVQGRVAGPAPALAIPGAVEQVLDNLIDNAVGVSPAGGTVTVEVRTRGGEVELRVLDQGPGLPTEARERAFDRFWRGDRERRGSGLGLAIVRQLVELSGGSVRLDEAPGGGLAAVVVLRTPPAAGDPATDGRR